MKNLKFIVLAIVVFPLGYYCINFFEHRISDSPADWGVFGDFIGGTANPLLSIVNIWVLWHLTKEVSKQDNQMALNQFRFDFYQKIKGAFNQFNEEEILSADIENLLMDLDSLIDYSFLFQEIEKEFLAHSEVLNETVLNMRDNYSDIIYDGVSGEVRDTAAFDELVNEFTKNKASFLKLLQKTIIR